MYFLKYLKCKLLKYHWWELTTIPDFSFCKICGKAIWYKPSNAYTSIELEAMLAEFQKRYNERTPLLEVPDTTPLNVPHRQTY